jgi:Zn-dependent M16 (insulinase) family peptidase
MAEGIIYKRVRGAGLAYGVHLQVNMRRGTIWFKVYRSPNGYAAWNEVRKIIQEISNGDVWSQVYLNLMLDYDS